MHHTRLVPSLALALAAAVLAAHARAQTTSFSSGSTNTVHAFNTYSPLSPSDTNRGIALFGQATGLSGRGMYGYASDTGTANIGVYGRSDSTLGTGLFAYAAATSGTTYGVESIIRSPTGYAGYFSGGRNYFGGFVGVGVANPLYPLHVSGSTLAVVGVATATSGDQMAGVKGLTTSTTGIGVWGVSLATTGNTTAGVAGESASTTGAGVAGHALATSGLNAGVFGQTESQTDGWGVYAQGDLGSSGMKAFNIDHPLDPARKYLTHFCAEGPEALLIYRGNTVLDESGQAWVTLPAYFESINKDVTYQLTPIGGPAPAMYISSEVADNRFQIAGGTPGLKVSWAVTGVRNDAYARAHTKPVEQNKPAAQVGTYLHPELHGAPPEAGLFYHAPAPTTPAPAPTTPAPAPTTPAQ